MSSGCSTQQFLVSKVARTRSYHAGRSNNLVLPFQAHHSDSRYEQSDSPSSISISISKLSYRSSSSMYAATKFATRQQSIICSGSVSCILSADLFSGKGERSTEYCIKPFLILNAFHSVSKHVECPDTKISRRCFAFDRRFKSLVEICYIIVSNFLSSTSTMPLLLRKDI